MKGIDLDAAARWRSDDEKHRPPLPDGNAADAAHPLISVTALPVLDGVVLRLVCLDESRRQIVTDIFCNAVTAAKTADLIRDAGKAGGWLTARGKVKAL